MRKKTEAQPDGLPLPFLVHLHRRFTGWVTASAVCNIGVHHLSKCVLPGDIVRIMAVIAGINLIIIRGGVAGYACDWAQAPVI